MSNYQDYYESKKYITLPNGDTYEGQIHGKVKQGYGTYKYSCGDIYEGDWENDEQQGNGILKFANGSVY